MNDDPIDLILSALLSLTALGYQSAQLRLQNALRQSRPDDPLWLAPLRARLQAGPPVAGPVEAVEKFRSVLAGVASEYQPSAADPFWGLCELVLAVLSRGQGSPQAPPGGTSAPDPSAASSSGAAPAGNPAHPPSSARDTPPTATLRPARGGDSVGRGPHGLPPAPGGDPFAYQPRALIRIVLLVLAIDPNHRLSRFQIARYVMIEKFGLADREAHLFEPILSTPLSRLKKLRLIESVGGHNAMTYSITTAGLASLEQPWRDADSPDPCPA